MQRGSDVLYDLQRFSAGCGNHRDARLDDPGFFERDLTDGIAEPLLVIKLHIRDDARERRDDVSGVEASAHAGLPNDEIATLLGKIAQRDDGDCFKECRMILY